MHGCYFALQHFRERGSGTLINIASALGRVPVPYYASYAASKYGVVGLGAALRQELAEHHEKHIHVCTVLPMAMDTPLYEHVGNWTGHEARPIPPLYRADKVVRAILRLASKPKAETIVGAGGKALAAAHRVARRPTERVMARHTGRTMIDRSPPAPITSGNVRQPVTRGTSVRSASLRKRRGARG
jgi:short-subunit dehydrogenase